MIATISNGIHLFGCRFCIVLLLLFYGLILSEVFDDSTDLLSGLAVFTKKRLIIDVSGIDECDDLLAHIILACIVWVYILHNYFCSRFGTGVNI